MIRVRERNNAWPSFVDLFANLVIVMIFLLIVFVFLWTTTSVFNRGTEKVEIAKLRKINAEHTQTIDALKESEEAAKALLLTARDELVALDATRTELAADVDALVDENGGLMAEREQIQNDIGAEREAMAKEKMELVASYEKKLYDLQAERDGLTATIGTLNAQIGAANVERASNDELNRKAAGLQTEIARLNNALSAAETARAATDVEYAAMSERLNKALADKASQLNKYQSQFFSAIHDALAGMGGVDVSSDRFVISSDILFPVGEFELSKDGKKQIGILAKVIKQMEQKIPANVSWVIRVDGHTDRLPVRKTAKRYKNNLDLSLLRAKEVVRELQADGVPERRLIPAGFGEDYPIVEGRTAKDLQKNRRIELRLTNP